MGAKLTAPAKGKTFIALVCILLSLCGCVRQRPGEENIPLSRIRCWTNTDVLRDLAFSPDHTVWAATPGGLLSFDRRSSRFSVYTVASGLPSNNVLCVLYRASGILWLGTNQGAACFDGEHFTCFGIAHGLLDQTVTALAEDADGTLYAGTERGMVRFNGSGWEPVNDSHEFARRPVRAITRDVDGSMWFVKEKALSHYMSDGTWEIYHKDVLSPNTKVPPLFRYLLCIAVDSSGTKWVGSEHGVYGYDGRSWQWYFNKGRLGTGSGLKDNRIEAVAAGPGRKLFIAHGNSPGFGDGLGVAFSTGTDQWTYLTTADGLPANKVYALKFDASNILWAGTAQGPAAVDGRHIIAFRPPAIIPDNHVIAMLPADGGRNYALLASSVVACTDGSIQKLPALPVKGAGAGIAANGSIYVAGQDTGLYRFSGGSSWKQESFFTTRKVLHLEKNGPAQMLAVAADGLFCRAGGNWSKLELKKMPAGFVPLKCFRDHQGRLWIIGTNGRVQAGACSALVMVQDGHPVPVVLPSLSLSYAHVNRILFDQDHMMYLAGPAGLYRYSPSGWQALALPVEKGGLSAAAWDAAGRLWIGGRDQGLFLRDRGIWREMLFAGKPAPGGITSIAFDHDTALWIGTSNQGLLRIELKIKTP
jgi:ligand-binding sensor domain-containing protein